MTNYIVNKTTTESFAAVADSLKEAIKMVEQEQGELLGINVGYNARPQQPVAPKPQ